LGSTYQYSEDYRFALLTNVILSHFGQKHQPNALHLNVIINTNRSQLVSCKS